MNYYLIIIENQQHRGRDCTICRVELLSEIPLLGEADQLSNEVDLWCETNLLVEAYETHWSINGIDVYIFEEEDAMAFKLTFG